MGGPLDDEPAEVVTTGQVNRRGKFKIRGWVGVDNTVTASEEGVGCRTYRNGRFVCRGRNLEPGTRVVITLEQPVEADPEPPVVDSSSEENNAGEWVASGQANAQGWIMIRGRVARGQSVEASHENVGCQNYPSGVFACRGKYLEPGASVFVTLQ